MSITPQAIARAIKLGEDRARSEIEDDPAAGPVDDPWKDTDPKDIIFACSNEKHERDSEEGWVIVDNYENGYYDIWMESFEDNE